jgi:hypothetical protein
MYADRLNHNASSQLLPAHRFRDEALSNNTKKNKITPCDIARFKDAVDAVIRGHKEIIAP